MNYVLCSRLKKVHYMKNMFSLYVIPVSHLEYQTYTLVMVQVLGCFSTFFFLRWRSRFLGWFWDGIPQEISLQPGNSDDVHAYNTYMVRTGKIFTSCLQQDCCDNSWKGLEKLSPLSPRSTE